MNLSDAQLQSLQNLRATCIEWVEGFGVSRPDAEDVFQQAIFKILNTESTLHDTEKLSSWFFSILKNTLFDEMRRQKTHNKKLNHWVEDPTLNAPTIEESFCGCVTVLMEDLPERDQDLLRLHFFEGVKLKDLAHKNRVSEGALRVQSLRAREKLRSALQKCCNATRFADVQSCSCKD